MAYKEVFSYEELSNKLGIHASMLCRYAQGLAVPNEQNVRKVINSLLSKESVKEYLYRYLSKSGWDLPKALSNHKVLNLLSLYTSNKMLSNLAGSGLKLLISLPGASALITSLTAIRLGLPIYLIHRTGVEPPTDSVSGYESVPARRGDYVAAIVDMLTLENLNVIVEYLNRHDLVLKCLITIVLVDKALEKAVGNLTLFDYLIP